MRRKWALIVGSAVTVVAAVGAAFVLAGRDDDGSTSVHAGAPACEASAIVDGEVLDDQYDLFRIEADGGFARLTTDRRSFEPSLAPDGGWFAYTWADEGSWDEAGGYSSTGIATMGVDGVRRATFPRVPGANDRAAAVSPDGRSVAFLRARGRTSEVVVAAADGGGPRVVLKVSDRNVGRPAWSPDSSKLVVNESGSEHAQLTVVDVAKGEVVDDVPVDHFVEGDAVWSPDGTKVVITSRNYEAGRPPVVVDLDTGTTADIPNPPDTTRTNAVYLGGSSDRLLVLRYPQSVELRPQRLETVDPTGEIRETLTLDMPSLDEGGDTRTLFGGLTTSRCYP